MPQLGSKGGTAAGLLGRWLGRGSVAERWRLGGWGIWCAVLAVVAMLVTRTVLETVDWLENRLFMTPSAWLASLLSGNPLLQDETGHWVLLTGAEQAQRVTAECSGIGFFSLLVGLCVWRCGGAARGVGAAWWPWLCLYPLALLTNACRISLSPPAALISEYLLGPRFHDIVHMAFGALFFATVLFTFNRLLVHAYGYRSQTR